MVSFVGELLTLLTVTTYSWIRMFIALGISMLLAIFIGIAAARSKMFGRISIPVIDVLQTLPILAFFPFAIYIVVTFIPGVIGVNAAVVFLIITSMLWNMIFGVYSAVRMIPNELIDMSKLYGMSATERFRKIFIPASLPRLSEQLSLSWAIGLFFLVTSEIFSTGNVNYTVVGIGSTLTQLGVSGNFVYYLTGIGVFILFVVVTRLTFFEVFDRYANKFNIDSYGKHRKPSEKVPHSSVILSRFSKALWRTKDSFRANIRLIKLSVYAVVAVMTVFIAMTSVPYLSGLSELPAYEAQALLALVYSLARVWIAFVAILAVGIPLSIYVVFMSKHKKSYMLTFQILASIPATLLLPVLVDATGHNSELVAFIVFFLSGLWYIIFSIISGSKYLSQNLLDVKEAFQVKGEIAWKKIYLMSILPGLITGAVTGIAAEWNASIIAEHFSIGPSNVVVTSVKTGIGQLLNTSLTSANLYLMVVALMNMTIMIILFNTFVWKKLYDKVTSVYS